MASNAMTDKAAQEIANKIASLNDKYFTTPTGSATKKPDPTAQAAAPQNPTPPTN